MTRMWYARIMFLGSVGVAVAETYRRGYVAPLLYGARLWCATLDPRTINEPDYMA